MMPMQRCGWRSARDVRKAHWLSRETRERETTRAPPSPLMGPTRGLCEPINRRRSSLCVWARGGASSSVDSWKGAAGALKGGGGAFGLDVERPTRAQPSGSSRGASIAGCLGAACAGGTSQVAGAQVASSSKSGLPRLPPGALGPATDLLEDSPTRASKRDVCGRRHTGLAALRAALGPRGPRRRFRRRGRQEVSTGLLADVQLKDYARRSATEK